MSIPSHILEQLNSQADLVGMIGKHTTLKRSGGTYRGKCPFHKGNSLSFSVNGQKNLYHCFKCSVSGNAFTFLKEYENLSFMEAVEELSRQTGIEVPKDDNKDLRYQRRSPPTAPAPIAPIAPIAPNSAKSPAPSGGNQTSTKPDLVADAPLKTTDATQATNGNAINDNTINSTDVTHSTRDIQAQTSPTSNFSNPTDSFVPTLTTNPDYATLTNANPDALIAGPPPDWQQSYAEQNYAEQSYAQQGFTEPGYSPQGDIPYADFDLGAPYEQSIPYPQNAASSHTVTGTALTNPVLNSQATSNQINHSGAKKAQAAEGNLYDLLCHVSAFYQTSLRNNISAMRYFKERGLTDATIEQFELGYAPAGWQHLEQVFAADIEGLKALGLVRTSEKGRSYNLLRDRVIFPIKDNQGRIIGFGGRALDNEVMPKYINSSDSPVFHKQYVLYGYYESRQKQAQDWLVVEGYMDVIALYQAGIYGAVASMGTAINEKQITRLLQMNPVLTLSFDGDDAGQKAAWRTLEIALPVLADGKELRFLTLPSGHDPDSYIKAHGIEVMREQIQQAVPLSQYVYGYLSERYDLRLAEGKAKLMAQVRELTAKLPKGSSFKHLLNNDIYQKISGRKHYKPTTAHDALLDFDSGMTSIDQLELCLLFNPHILQDDPITQIWEAAAITAIKLPRLTPDVSLPALPSWQDFEDANLLKLVEVILPLLPHLPKDTNAAAHFILANLPQSIQQELSERWHSFWSNLSERDIIEIKELTDELLIHLMLAALKKQLQQAKHIVCIGYINKQRQTLSNWHKIRQAEQATKI